MSATAPARSKHRKRAVVASLAILIAGTIGLLAWSLTRPTAQERFSQAKSLFASHDYRRAEQVAAAAFQQDPTLDAASLLAAEAAAAGQNYERAIEHAEQVTTENERIALKAALLRAEILHHRLYRFSAAESAYLDVLKIDAGHSQANTALANLLALCGRRREAVPRVLRLIEQGEVTDLLVLLARETGVISDPALLEKGRQADPLDPNPLVGLAWHAAFDGRTTEAIVHLRKAVKLQPDHLAAQILLGKQLLDAQNFEGALQWNRTLPASANEVGETWEIRARIAEHLGQDPEALRCYGEAARRTPESKTALSRLATLLAQSGRDDESAKIRRQLENLQALERQQDRVLFAGTHESLDPLFDLIECYRRSGRLWEAFGWSQLAADLNPSSSRVVQLLNEFRQATNDLPLMLTDPSFNEALTIDLSRYPLPEFEAPKSDRTAPSQQDLAPESLASVRFRNDAAEAGLVFRYLNGTTGPTTHRMYEFTGGGIAVLDYDLDGAPDTFFTQGTEWPPGTKDGPRDTLFRNVGSAFENITLLALPNETGFGQGTAVGDLDSDGFPDLFVGNIGSNQLLRNNGDGTFTDVTASAGLVGQEWTTSAALADFNGDGLTDLYEANYVTGADVFERTCPDENGIPRMCMPFDFDGASDQLWINRGDGQFTNATDEMLSVTPDGKGLGVAVWDAQASGRLNLLVANDTTPNLFFAAQSTAAPLGEQGLAAGVALNEDGKAEGSMGIALGDVDDDGQLDLCITNFSGESNTFYSARSAGYYEDRTREVGLYEPSLPMLGFGTQFLDGDNDGRLELFVANGHIDDLRDRGKPYHMRAQLFRWTGSRFIESDPKTLGEYFTSEWLGRPVARIDWNRDGYEDLLIGHLHDDSALLTNVSPQQNNALSLKLVGVASNRDGIGTTVTAKLGAKTLTRQLTAGDGYQASNERRLVVGAGLNQSIAELTVRWPSGLVQRFENVQIPLRATLIEGQSRLVTAATSSIAKP